MRRLKIAAVFIVAIGLIAYWIASSQPTYAAPDKDEIEILIGLGGVFPESYGIVWRQHGALRASDELAQQHPGLLQGALFTHHLVTSNPRSDSDVWVQVAYEFYERDRDLNTDDMFLRLIRLRNDQVSANDGAYGCWCGSISTDVIAHCYGELGYGNYHFSILVDYNTRPCTSNEDAAQRLQREFLKVVTTADLLIHAWLEPLRQKPRWL